ncbi:MAG: hypothetical protein Q4E34_00350 [Synergistaceae bacterium]|nr:hypothetical protein [Synergistaceae bacterium]
MDWLVSLLTSSKKKEAAVGEEQKKRDQISVDSATAVSSMESAKLSVEQANAHFAKQPVYDRRAYEDSSAMRDVKIGAFKNNVRVKDPYSNKELVLTKAEAKQRFGSKWQEHLAESDHTTPLHKIHQEHNKDVWTTQDDLKRVANDEDNMQLISRSHNNAKRGRTEEEFVTDDEYLKKTKVKISSESKEKAIEAGRKAHSNIETKLNLKAAKNIVQTGHEAGIKAASNASELTFAMSAIQNMRAVMNGDKDAANALVDTAKDTTKAAGVAYLVGGNATVIGHTLSSSSSKFLQSLQKSNVPAKVIVSVMQFGDLFKRLSKGEISSQEFVLGFGERGLNIATAGYSMMVGQALIPIPAVGAAIGALIGSAITSNMFHSLIDVLRNKELEHQERLRLIEEYHQIAEQMKINRDQLIKYSEYYFQDCRECFNEAIGRLDCAFSSGDAEGVITSANTIAEKLGGTVKYRNMQEFKTYLADDAIDVL